jgi:hypothetical protein
MGDRNLTHVRPLMLSCLAAAIGLAGCSKGNAQPPSEQGFYRYTDGQGVYYVQPAQKTRCMVGNPSMMEAYGGFKQVHVVGHDIDIEGAGAATGACRWPPGYYRKADVDVVYHVRDTDVCRMRSRPKVPVVLVSAESNILISLPFAGDCR